MSRAQGIKARAKGGVAYHIPRLIEPGEVLSRPTTVAFPPRFLVALSIGMLGVFDGRRCMDAQDLVVVDKGRVMGLSTKGPLLEEGLINLLLDSAQL